MRRKVIHPLIPCSVHLISPPTWGNCTSPSPSHQTFVLLYVESCWYKESDRSIHSDSWPLLILKRWTFLTAEQVLKSRQRIRKEMM